MKASRRARERRERTEYVKWRRELAEAIQRADLQSIDAAIERHMHWVLSAPFDDNLVLFIANSARAWHHAPLIRQRIAEAREGVADVS